MTTFKTQKSYFKGNKKFGRTTQLLKDGVVVAEFMGVCTLAECLKSYNR
jgi:hypothetical protein